MIRCGPEKGGAAAAALAMVAAIGVLALMADAVPAAAQARNPFGVGAPAPAAPPSGFIGWILAMQAEFHRSLIAGVRAVKSGGGAGGLILAGFLYGAFHAVGPGHGKAIVSSYVFANEQALRRGVLISFLAAFIQAIVAIALVWGVLQVFAGTARQIDASVRWIEIGAFGLIIAFGLYLTARKATAVWRLWRTPEAPEACDECSGRFQLRYTPSARDGGGVRRPVALGAAAAPASVAACGHTVIPGAEALRGEQSLGSLLTVALAAGARPCTGAILILALARAADVFAVGILAVFAMALGTALATSGFAIAASGAKGAMTALVGRTERWRGAIAVLELLAALAITFFGAALLLGYMTGD